jgi:membrane protease YdiL (CAAX protease family)
MSPKTRLILVLWVAGFIGIVSLLLLDFDAFIALLPAEAAAEVPRVTVGLKLLSLVQPAVFLTLAVFGGAALAPKVGLSAPAFEAWTTREPTMPALRPQWLPGLLGGAGGGIAIVLIAALANPELPPGAAAKISAFAQLMPFPTRLLYGGITEEVLLRWGLMSLLVWAGWRLFQKRETHPPAGCFHAAIIISALIFGAGHLPVAFFVVPEPNVALVAFVIIANAAFGVVAGYLFWRRGLEAAILAHMVTHGVLFAASRVGVYF